LLKVLLQQPLLVLLILNCRSKRRRLVREPLRGHRGELQGNHLPEVLAVQYGSHVGPDLGTELDLVVVVGVVHADLEDCPGHIEGLRGLEVIHRHWPASEGLRDVIEEHGVMIEAIRREGAHETPEAIPDHQGHIDSEIVQDFLVDHIGLPTEPFGAPEVLAQDPDVNRGVARDLSAEDGPAEVMRWGVVGSAYE
jgi:hypothetical protein